VRGRRIAAWLTAPLGYVRRRNRLVSQWPEGVVALGPRVALFCHFEPAGALRADTLRYLTELRDFGFSVVLVSNSGRLQPAAMTALRRVCAAVLLRANSGRDFGAWREALVRLGLPRTETRWLLLANDSVSGPLAPLAPLLMRMDNAADVWGMTDSVELGWHLQSYFLLVGPAALRSLAWRRFWRGVRPVPSKLLTVIRYEIGLSRCLRLAGLRLAAMFPCDAGAGPLNPTLAGWRALRDAGFPFIKRSVAVDGNSTPPENVL
jgi:lipopolysaccharide biosynthesis protein